MKIEYPTERVPWTVVCKKGCIKQTPHRTRKYRTCATQMKIESRLWLQAWKMNCRIYIRYIYISLNNDYPNRLIQGGTKNRQIDLVHQDTIPLDVKMPRRLAELVHTLSLYHSLYTSLITLILTNGSCVIIFIFILCYYITLYIYIYIYCNNYYKCHTKAIYEINK